MYILVSNIEVYVHLMVNTHKILAGNLQINIEL